MTICINKTEQLKAWISWTKSILKVTQITPKSNPDYTVWGHDFILFYKLIGYLFPQEYTKLLKSDSKDI